MVNEPEPADENRLGALRNRLETLLPELDTPPEGKLSQWVFERLPLLSDRDIGFVHTLCSNIERTVYSQARLNSAKEQDG